MQIGKSIKLREGNDGALVSTGGMLPVAMAAADLLQAENISCRVISMHTVKPLDTAALEACCTETKALFTLEEHRKRWSPQAIQRCPRAARPAN